MKSKFLITSVLVIASAGCFLTSCKKNNTVPTNSSTSQLSFGIKSDNATAPVASGTASITFTAGTANVSSFKFEAKKHGSEVEIRSHSLTHIDLFSLTSSLTGATIDTGLYSEIEVRVELIKSATADLPLILKGSLKTSGGTIIPFEFDFNDDAEIKAEAQNVVVDGKTDLTTLITMHLNKLLTNVSDADINALSVTNNTIVISGTSNVGVYNKIKSSLTESGDSDGFEKHEKSGNGRDN